MAEELAEAGGAVTAGLIAREIERARVGAPAVGHGEDEPCANCGAVRQGPYCHVCGQSGHVHRTAGALVHDIAHGVFHFEGRIWSTLPLLVLRPGELTRRYVRGERAKFVSPVALFLFSVFLMFAVVSGLAGHEEAQAPAGAARDLAGEEAQLDRRIARLQAQASSAAPPARAALAQELDDARRELETLRTINRRLAAARSDAPGAEGGENRLDIDTGWHWLDQAANHAARNPELVLYKMKSYGYKYSWALIPLSLPFLWLLFAFRRDVGLYDHAIFATYSLSFMSLGVVALSVLDWIGVPGALIFLAGLCVPPIHMYRQLKGAYALGRLGAAWRTAALLMIVTVTSVLYIGLLFYLGT